MLAFEIHFDDSQVWNLMTDLERSQVPFATALAMNQTMNEVQAKVREDAYTNVFVRRNKALPKALTMIPNKMRATKKRLKVSMVNVRDSRTGRMAGAGFVERQIKGQTKTARGSNIAIPVLGPGMRRNKTGGVPKGKHPRANSKLFRVGDRLVERQRKKLVTRYALTPTARPNSAGRFRYYETARRVATGRLRSNWNRAMLKAVKSSVSRHSGSSRARGMSQ